MPHFFHSATSCPYIWGCQSDKTEVRQPTDWCACALTKPNPWYISHTQHKSINPWAERKPAMWPVPKCHPFSSSSLLSIPHLEKILRWKIRGALMSKERCPLFFTFRLFDRKRVGIFRYSRHSSTGVKVFPPWWSQLWSDSLRSPGKSRWGGHLKGQLLKIFNLDFIFIFYSSNPMWVSESPA